ncbi:hypothetical protein [Anaerovibrio lipolyticus]|uniref:hypothetical protein n=1 Tax=Anaerovibrio lipolyticus TaxID=82374 RepID=UPI0026F2A50A|nr:hypothetical protein [Anaerovibrio lipolyticus]MBE6105969.1 hypothetical protein [Anaerovibrio lipolyticus]
MIAKLAKARQRARKYTEALYTVKKMVDKGLLTGGGLKDAGGYPADLDLSLDMLRLFVVNDRAGLY